MARPQLAVETRSSLLRAAIPLLVFLLVLLNWSILRGADAVTQSLTVGAAVYRIALHVALLAALAAVVGLAVRKPRTARQSPVWLAVLGFAAASVAVAALGGFLTFALGA